MDGIAKPLLREVRHAFLVVALTAVATRAVVVIDVRQGWLGHCCLLSRCLGCNYYSTVGYKKSPWWGFLVYKPTIYPLNMPSGYISTLSMYKKSPSRGDFLRYRHGSVFILPQSLAAASLTINSPHVGYAGEKLIPMFL
jgi:hypothetical protein